MFFVLLGIRVLTRCELSSWDRPSRSPFARDGEVPSLLHRAAERHGDRDRRPRPPEGTRALQEVIDAATAQGAQETLWSGAYSCGVDVVTCAAVQKPGLGDLILRLRMEFGAELKQRFGICALHLALPDFRGLQCRLRSEALWAMFEILFASGTRPMYFGCCPAQFQLAARRPWPPWGTSR